LTQDEFTQFGQNNSDEKFKINCYIPKNLRESRIQKDDSSKNGSSKNAGQPAAEKKASHPSKLLKIQIVGPVVGLLAVPLLL